MASTTIKITGARQHNLRNLSLEIPREKLVVITGASGSGKSSLAFDTLFAEGQRRYVESLSSYARQFLDQLQKPDVDFIEGLSPAIAIEQRTSGGNPRSTIATTTEIYDYLRLLYASVGTPHDPRTGARITRQTPQMIVDAIEGLPVGSRVMVLAPVVEGQVGEFRDVLEKLRRQGFVRVRVDGTVQDLQENERLKLDKNAAHQIEVVVDRLVIREERETSRVTDSVETALKWGNNRVYALHQPAEEREKWELAKFSTDFANPETGFTLPRLTPKHFSFNSHHGACPHCHGLGVVLIADPELLIADEEKPLNEGALADWLKGQKRLAALFELQLAALAKHYRVKLETPFNKVPRAFREALFNGSGDEEITLELEAEKGKEKVKAPFEGLASRIQRMFDETQSDSVKRHLRRYLGSRTCPVCQGRRLRPEILAVTLTGPGGREIDIQEYCALSIAKARDFTEGLQLDHTQHKITGEVLREIGNRLNFLADVGLGYLSLNRESGTLSGGESQRIRLATQIGSGLAGVLYVLDEPSIGLHKRDNDRLIETLLRLRDLGNSVVVVEHDEDTIRAADWVVDMGPGAGPLGGQIISQGTVAHLLADPQSITGQFLSGRTHIPVPRKRQKPWQPTSLDRHWLTVTDATENNLKNVTANFPLGCFTCVTGISGSGKSTLINDILYKALARYFYNAKDVPGKHGKILGLNEIDKVVVIDQSPIGRTPRSNPATYTGAFSPIRELFAGLPLSRVRGYDAGRFSFNTKGGRCENCQGDGLIKIEMHFLADVFVPCEVCHGQRYNRETLEVTYKGKNVADILEMNIDEAFTFFRHVPVVQEKLESLLQVGLGYLRLGQPGNTLSGGEAQRVKIATELARKATGRTLYILDEPTTGLHFADIQKLLEVLMKLRTSGNTLIVIEHNLEMIKCADWVIDMGPDGGEHGGEIVAEGTPEEIAENPRSVTGPFLKGVLPALA
jgi:excinuclease ABC subunit A